MATLPGSSLMVWVGPPLFCSPLGSRLSPVALFLLLLLGKNWQESSLARFPPPSVMWTGPPQSPTEPTRMVLVSVDAPLLNMALAVLPLKVLLASVSVPKLLSMAPPTGAILLLKVLLVIIKVP